MEDTNWKMLHVDCRKILKWILKKHDLRMWTVSMWFRIGSSSGLLWLLINFLSVNFLVRCVTAFPEELCSMRVSLLKLLRIRTTKVLAVRTLLRPICVNQTFVCAMNSGNNYEPFLQRDGLKTQSIDYHLFVNVFQFLYSHQYITPTTSNIYMKYIRVIYMNMNK